MQRPGERPVLSYELLVRLDETGVLPGVTAQMENYLLCVASLVQAPGENAELNDEHHGSVVGAAHTENFIWIWKTLHGEGLLDGRLRLGGLIEATPTAKGWLRIEQLRRGRSDSKKIFMAMQYGEPELDDVVAHCFRPAVEATGFRLERLDTRPRAGLIDDRLRVEIRTSRFLIADLTHGNQGAYWEAGFAEGLGKPVIYTCRRDVFTEKKTHFDTNHHLTVAWDKSDLANAGELLKATIRATLPDEAKLVD
jgi:hypothetical protein